MKWREVEREGKWWCESEVLQSFASWLSICALQRRIQNSTCDASILHVRDVQGIIIS